MTLFARFLRPHPSRDDTPSTNTTPRNTSPKNTNEGSDDHTVRHFHLRRRQPPLRDAGRAHQVTCPTSYKQRRRLRRGRDGRTKIVVRGQISEYIPNPTFDVVARPGAQEDYFRKGNPEGKSRREIFGEPMRVASRRSASRRPRLELMDEQGIDRALMFPTLASLVEERMRDDPDMIHAVDPRPQRVDARDVEVRLRGPHLHHAGHHAADRRQGDRGARVGRRARRQGRAHPPGAGPRLPRPPLVRPAGVRPVLGEGRRARHPRRACTRPTAATSATPTTGWAATARCCRSSRRRSACCRRGARSRTRSRRSSATARCQRFPQLKVAVVENGSSWVEPLLNEHGRHLQEDAAGLPRGPGRRRSSATSTSARSGRRTSARWPSCIGVDHVLFGSDYPHPEGLADPASYVDELERPAPRSRRARSWAATSPA